MAKQSQSTISIPSSLVPQFEAWANLTSRLFRELRLQTGLEVPDTLIDDQAWYWTKQWQEWERKADEDIAAGRVKRFSSIDKLIADLDV